MFDIPYLGTCLTNERLLSGGGQSGMGRALRGNRSKLQRPNISGCFNTFCIPTELCEKHRASCREKLQRRRG